MFRAINYNFKWADTKWYYRHQDQMKKSTGLRVRESRWQLLVCERLKGLGPPCWITFLPYASDRTQLSTRSEDAMTPYPLRIPRKLSFKHKLCIYTPKYLYPPPYTHKRKCLNEANTEIKRIRIAGKDPKQKWPKQTNYIKGEKNPYSKESSLSSTKFQSLCYVKHSWYQGERENVLIPKDSQSLGQTDKQTNN